MTVEGMRQAGSVVLGAALGLLLWVPAAEARCQRTDYIARPDKNTVSKVLMIASSGKECVLRLSATRRTTVTARRILVPPDFGRATIEGETVFYRARPGYTGPDRFTAEMAGKGADGEGVATVVVEITVED